MATNFKHIDPTFLRTIFDGLVSGSLHKDNTSALPAGLVGIYEEALPPESNVNKRKKFLEFFAVWTLLKKEVSAAFVSQVLGWTEKRVLDYIALYSKWFNTPLTGKYVIYHERFRSFVIQKISHAQFAACNEAIIQLGQRALESRSGAEFEHYALEHLSSHILTQAMESKDATALKTLTYSTIHWNRQVEISNGFEWSKRMLNDMMVWASKYDEEEVIECALNKVDLFHNEQNDAPRILRLVADADIETALERIEKFGGGDKEGLVRKFILYMLCLMELTLKDAKDKKFAKSGIERLLKHFDKHIPANQPDLINWSDFFPSHLVLFIVIENIEFNVNVECVFKRTTQFDFNKIILNDSNFQSYIKYYDVLIQENDKKEDDLSDRFIDTLLSFKSDEEMIYLLLSKFPNKHDYIFKAALLVNIKSNSINKSEEFFDSIKGIENKLLVINRILLDLKKSYSEHLVVLLSNLFDKIEYLIFESDELKCKYWQLKTSYFNSQNKSHLARMLLNKSIKLLSLINSKKIDNLRYKLIPDVYCLIGKEKALQLFNDMSNSLIKLRASELIIKSMCEDGEISEAHKICLQFNNPFEKAVLYNIIAKYEISNKGLSSGMKTIRLIPRESRDSAIIQLIRFFLKHNRVDYAIELCNDIYFQDVKCEAYMYICEYYLKRNEMKEFLIFKEKIITHHVVFELFTRSLNIISIEHHSYLNIKSDFDTFCDYKEISRNKRTFSKFIDFLCQHGLYNEVVILFGHSLNEIKNESISFRHALKSLIKMHCDDHEKLVDLFNYVDLDDLSNEMMILDSMKSSLQSGNIEKIEELRFFIKDPLHRLEFDCHCLFGILNSRYDKEDKAYHVINKVLDNYKKLKNRLNSYDWALGARYYHLKSDNLMIEYFTPLLLKFTVSDSVLINMEKISDSNLRFDLLYNFFVENGILGYDWESESASILLEFLRKACGNVDLISKVRNLVKPLGKLARHSNETLDLNKLKDSELNIRTLIELLQLFALDSLIFKDLSSNQIKRLDNCLDLKWAIDIKNRQR